MHPLLRFCPDAFEQVRQTVCDPSRCIKHQSRSLDCGRPLLLRSLQDLFEDGSRTNDHVHESDPHPMEYQDRVRTLK